MGARYPGNLRAVCERLQGVIIENRPAAEVRRSHDARTTLHYVDPPYLTGTRVAGNRYYSHEMTDSGHAHLLTVAKDMEGMVMLSGYDSELYRDMLTGWKLVTRESRISAGRGTGVRTECLWLSPNIAGQDAAA